MAHEKMARALVQGAAAYVDKRLAGIVDRLTALEQRVAAAEFVRAQSAATSSVEQARSAARVRAGEGDEDVVGIIRH